MGFKGLFIISQPWSGSLEFFSGINLSKFLGEPRDSMMPGAWYEEVVLHSFETSFTSVVF